MKRFNNFDDGSLLIKNQCKYIDKYAIKFFFDIFICYTLYTLPYLYCLSSMETSQLIVVIDTQKFNINSKIYQQM